MNNPDALLKIQYEVQAQMGKNLLNYQLIEKLLKYIVKASSLKIIQQDDGSFKNTQTKTDKLMLGLLVGKFTSDIAVLVAPLEEAEINENEQIQNKMTMQFNYRTEYLNNEDYSLMIKNIEKLVFDRNELVHHFSEKYSIKLFESCKNGLEYLVAKNKFSIEQFEYFKSIALELESAIKIFSEFMSSKNFEEYILGSLIEPEPDQENLH